MSMTALATSALALYRALEARGIDACALFRDAGFAPELLKEPERRVRSELIYRIWERALAETDDACIGLTLWPHLHPAVAHGLGYAWLASATLTDAMNRLIRYGRVINDVWRLSLYDEPEGVRIMLRSQSQRAVLAQMIDGALAGIVAACRVSFGPDFAPLRVQFSHGEPACAQRFAEHFRAPVEFGAADNTLLCRRDDMLRRLPTANVDMALASDRVLTDYLARLDREDVQTQVRRAVIEALPSGTPTEAELAQALQMSHRTLQRRLAEAGTSFSTLLDEVRRELAMQHLGDLRKQVTQIAFLLGFAEVASFNRAFKRWTGRTPTEYRAAPLATAPEPA